MADVLDIVIVPTYDVNTMAVVDHSVYEIDPPTDPQIEIDVPAFDTVTLPFLPDSTNIFDSTDLGITTGTDYEPLPDGIYCFRYSSTHPHTTYVEKRILRVDKLQQKFDEAFMKLDMMECDGDIKKQQFVTLNSIYFFIQGAIAAANHCATISSTKLYIQADTMLDSFINNDCGCSGNNYTVTFS